MSNFMSSNVNHIRTLSSTQMVRMRPEKDLGQVLRRPIMEWALTGPAGLEHGEWNCSTCFLQCVREFVHNSIDAQRTHPQSKIVFEATADHIMVMDEGNGWDLRPLPDDPNMRGPERCFTCFNTGTNLDDKNVDPEKRRERTGAGRNGFGIKGCVSLSRSTMLLVVNGDEFMEYVFVPFADKIRTMHRVHGTRETKPQYFASGKNYTMVRWYPDLAVTSRHTWNPEYLRDWPTPVFADMNEIDLVTRQVAARCVVDAGIDVKRIDIRIESMPPLRAEMNMLTYTRMYFPSVSSENSFSFKFVGHGGRTECEYVFVDAYEASRHIGFANGVCSTGIHIDGAIEYITTLFKRYFKQVTPGLIRRHVSVIAIVHGQNPQSSSQTKDVLCEISGFKSLSITKDARRTDDVYAKNIMKWKTYQMLHDAAEDAARRAKAAENEEKKRAHVDKVNKSNIRATMYDAAEIRGPSSVLLVCEGVSAGSYVNTFRRLNPLKQQIGVLCLAGVPSNTADGDVRRVRGSLAEILRVLGLPLPANGPSSVSSTYGMKYGHLVLMSDADEDGTHIALLVLEMFAVYYPRLVEAGFIKRLYTPVVRVYRGNEIFQRFINENQFAKWSNGRNMRGLDVVYFKGLGSGGAEQAKDDLNHAIVSTYRANEGWATNMKHMFGKEHAEDRKKLIINYSRFLSEYEPQFTPHVVSLRLTTRETMALTIANSMTTEYVSFCATTLRRHIPKISDGLKKVQRQIISSANAALKGKMKLIPLAGKITQDTHYHHGETSLYDAITSMTRSCPNANNVPWFAADAAVGDRVSVPAAARYITVWKAPYFNALIEQEMINIDLIPRNMIENEKCELSMIPTILPMVLINGASGMATGWQCEIPSHHPMEIIHILKSFCTGNPVAPYILKPFFRGFRGQIDIRSGHLNVERIVAVDDDPDTDEPLLKTVTMTVPRGYTSRGVWKIDGNVLWVGDMPHSVRYPQVKEHFEKLRQVDEPEQQLFVGDLIDDSNGDNVAFHVQLTPLGITAVTERPQDFMLIKNYSLSGFNLLDDNDTVIAFPDAFSYLCAFYKHKLTQYDMLKAKQLVRLQDELAKTTQQIKYLEAAIAGVFAKIDGKPLPEQVFLQRLQSIEVSEQIARSLSRRHETREQVEHFRAQHAAAQKAYDELLAREPSVMYLEKLQSIETVLAPMFK